MTPDTRLKLTDLLDFDSLQRLQDGFAEASTVATVIVDADGTPITRPSNCRDICASCCGTSSGFGTCHAKTRAMIAPCREAGTPSIADCPLCGMKNAALPIIVDGVFMGCWIFGPLLTSEPSEEEIAQVAEKLELDSKALSVTVAGLPRYTDGIQYLFAIVETTTHNMVALGRKNMELAEVGRQLENRDNVLTKCVEASVHPIYIRDYETGEIFIANQALCRLLDVEEDEVIGKSCRSVFEPKVEGFCSVCPHPRLFDKFNEPTGHHTREVFFTQKGLWLRITSQAIAWGPDHRAQMVTIEDISQEHSMRGQLEKLAYFDTLTGLPNANKLSLDFRKGLGTGAFADSYLLCCDLSSLRLFVDAYGREVGNEMLKTIMDWIQNEYSGSEKTYLLDIYEFCLLLDKQSGVERARALAKAIQERFEKPWRVLIEGNDIAYVCGISVSILRIPEETRSLQDFQNLISRTISSGRETSGIFLYDQEKDRENHEHTRLVVSLKECINTDMKGFSLNYQPIARLSSGLWAGVEALCRWTRPGGGPVPPPVFIHEAESLGLINELGLWVLDTAVRQVRELGLDTLDDFFLSVNISPIQMMDPAFADAVRSVLNTHQYPGNRLNLEITESAQVTFSAFTMNMIAELRSMGIRLALDDFGTGYSSFSSLRNLPVDFIKTEREFILGIEDDESMQYFFFILSEIAHAAKMKFIAEGIETVEQLKIAKNNGADYIQGYFFSKPLPFDALKEKYERFVVPDHSYIPETADVINIQRWLSGRSAYELTPALFNLMNRCMQIILSETAVNSAIQSIFETVGDHFGVSRAFAFVQEDRPGIYSNQFEWCNDRIKTQKHLLQRIPVLVNSPSLYEAFKEDGMLVCSSVKELDTDLREALQGQDVMSVLLIPMWDEAELLGFAGFDRIVEHAWSPEEIVMLWNVAILLANTLKREKLKLEVVEKKSLLDTVLQHSGINAYVADMKTHDLLWMNDAMLKARGLDHAVIGKKCYRVLASFDEPCSFCQMPGMLENPQAGCSAHGTRSRFTGKEYTAYGSLVQWSGNENAFLHYFMDVKDQENTERQLEHLASTDMLTGAFNRTAIINLMQDMIREAHEKETPLAVCFTNLRRLKDMNARHGHETGDQALFHMVQAIRGAVQRQDAIGRLSADHFIVVMPGCAKGLAKVRMVQARSALAAVKLLPGHESLTFSFGVADNGEFAYEENAVYYAKLLATAEKRMREQPDIDMVIP